MDKEFEKFKKNLLKNKKFRKAYDKKMSDPIYVTAREIRLARIKKGLTQSELAKKVKTKQSAIARAENGKTNISIKFLEKIANALGTKLIPPKLKILEEAFIDDYNQNSKTRGSSLDLCPELEKTMNEIEKNKISATIKISN